MDYYDELLKTINDYISKQDFDRVKTIIEEEFKVAYIPKDVENKLKEIYDSLPIDIPVKYLNDEEIEEYLYSSYEKQLRAVDELNKRNLRDYYDLCNKYLSSDGFKNAKVLLIESLIRQEISDEFTYKNEGMEYNFIPRYIMLPEESLGFQVAYKELSEIFMKEPSKFEMSKSLLYKECLLALPINFVEEEGHELAEKISNYINDAFNK